MSRSTHVLLGFAATSALAFAAASGALAAPGSGYGPGMGGAGYGPGMMGGPGYGPGAMGRPGMGPAVMMSPDPVGATQQQLAELKRTLGITLAQEGAWKAYANAVTARTAVMLSHRATMYSAGPVGSYQRAAFHQQGFAQMQQVVTATNNLNAVLTPPQKAKAGGLLGAYGPGWRR